MARTDAPAVHDVITRRAPGAKEAELGTHLTVGQRAAVLATATSGRGVELTALASDLWAQRETHQRWASKHPEATRRLDHLAGEIDSMNRSLGDGSLPPHRARDFDERMARVVGTALERGLGIDLGL